MLERRKDTKWEVDFVDSSLMRKQSACKLFMLAFSFC